MHTRNEPKVRDMFYGGLLGIGAALLNLGGLCYLLQMAEPALMLDASSIISIIGLFLFGFWLIDTLVTPLRAPLVEWPHVHTATVTSFCFVVASCAVASYFAEGDSGRRLLMSALVALGFFTGLIVALLYNWDDMSKPYPADHESKNPAF